MKRSLIIAGAIVAVLTGCGTATADDFDPTPDLHLAHITVPGRGDVQCVVFSAGYEGGLSCDWSHAK